MNNFSIEVVIDRQVCYTADLLNKLPERRLILEQEILTIAEAAAFLKVGKRTIYKLVQEKKIPAKRILNKWRFERERLLKWVAEGN